MMKKIPALLLLLLMTLAAALSLAEEAEIEPTCPTGDAVVYEDNGELIPRGNLVDYTCPDGTQFLTGEKIDFELTLPEETKTLVKVSISIHEDWTSSYQACYISKTPGALLSYTFYEPGEYRIFLHYKDEATNKTTFYRTRIINIRKDSTHPDYTAQKVSEIAGLCNKACPGGSDYDKALWLHDYLATHCYYDSTTVHHSAAYLLVKGYGVCQSFAIAYRKLLRACNIECDVVYSKEMYHLWNAVELDGEWYMTDLTWDTLGKGDAGTGSAVDYCIHKWFAEPQCVFNSDHGVNLYVNQWECTSIDDNYFAQNGYAKAIVDCLEEGIGSFIETAEPDGGEFELDVADIFSSSTRKCRRATREFPVDSSGVTKNGRQMNIGLGAELAARYLNGSVRTNAAGQKMKLTATHQACGNGVPKTKGTIYTTIQVKTELVREGICGDPSVNGGKNVTWSLLNGTLTISGTGGMNGYSAENPAPWNSLSESITSLSVADGVTSIGAYAFSGCGKLTGISLPGSVTAIADDAFSGCTALAVASVACKGAGYTFAKAKGLITGVTHFDVSHIEALDPTCGEDGCIEYWHCTDCGKYFSDGACTSEITRASAVRAKTHIHDADQNGKCKVCGRAFAMTGKNVLVLPSGLTALRKQSFAGIAAENVVIPKNCTAIENAAVSGTGLRAVLIPDTLKGAFPSNAIAAESTQTIEYVYYDVK